MIHLLTTSSLVDNGFEPPVEAVSPPAFGSIDGPLLVSKTGGRPSNLASRSGRKTNRRHRPGVAGSVGPQRGQCVHDLMRGRDRTSSQRRRGLLLAHRHDRQHRADIDRAHGVVPVASASDLSTRSGQPHSVMWSAKCPSTGIGCDRVSDTSPLERSRVFALPRSATTLSARGSGLMQHRGDGPSPARTRDRAARHDMRCRRKGYGAQSVVAAVQRDDNEHACIVSELLLK